MATDADTEILPAEFLTLPLAVRELVSRINRSVRKQAAEILQIGTDCYELRMQPREVRRPAIDLLNMSPPEFSAYVGIGKKRILHREDVRHRLPPFATLIYVVARWPDSVIEKAVLDEKLNPNARRLDLEAYHASASSKPKPPEPSASIFLNDDICEADADAVRKWLDQGARDLPISVRLKSPDLMIINDTAMIPVVTSPSVNIARGPEDGGSSGEDGTFDAADSRDGASVPEE